MTYSRIYAYRQAKNTTRREAARLRGVLRAKDATLGVPIGTGKRTPRNKTGLSRNMPGLSRAEANALIARATAAKRGDTQRGRGAGVSYIKFMGRHMHRVIAEQKIGRPLQKGEVVHHIDGNHRNNDPDNLVVITQSIHARLHRTGWRKAKGGPK